MKPRGYKDLIVYKKAYELAMDVFHVTRKFPKEETYSLTDQLRRSSRAVCAILGEAYRRRNFPKYFTLKMMDADGECTESIIHLDFAFDCGYIDKDTPHGNLVHRYEEIGRMFSSMSQQPEKFIPRKPDQSQTNKQTN